MQHKRNKNRIVQMVTIIYKEKILPNKSKILWSLLVFFLIGVVSGLTVFALNKSKAASTTCYFVGDTNPANWNDASHWSSSSGGAGSTCDGGTVPGSDDNVIFDGGSVNTVTVDADINIASLNITSGYTGTFDNATNDKNVTVSGDVTLDGTRVDMGDGTWTVSGSFDMENLVTLNCNASTLIMNGSLKELTTRSAGATVINNVTIPLDASINVIVKGIPYVAGIVIVDGILETTSTFVINNDIKISNTGSFDGRLLINESGKISQKDGPINGTFLVYPKTSVVNKLIPATYEAHTVYFDTVQF